MSFAEASEWSHWGPRCCNWREHVQSLASHAESKLRPAPRTHTSRYVSYGPELIPLQTSDTPLCSFLPQTLPSSTTVIHVKTAIEKISRNWDSHLPCYMSIVA